MANSKKTVHLMGICGTAMGSLAGLFKDLGYQVQGSDHNVYPPMSTKLENLGIKIMEGYKPYALDKEKARRIDEVVRRAEKEIPKILAEEGNE